MSEAEEYKALFAQELDGQIGALVHTKPWPDGRWSAWLTPEHSFVLNGLQPPGQVNIVGPDGWIVENTFTPEFEAGTLSEVFAELREDYRAAWAARPYFYSHDAAQKSAEAWIRENRPDIVQECAAEASRAISYRQRNP